MSFSTGCRKCQKCGKMYLINLFDGGLCAECEKAEQEPCDDTISRQAVLDCATLITSIPTEDWDIGDWVCLFRDRVSQLPSVRPQEPTGHWVMSEDGLYRPICDKCGAHPWKGYIPTVEEVTKVYNYCPSCGAKMVEPQESEGGMSQEVIEHYEKLGAYYNEKGENK